MMSKAPELRQLVAYDIALLGAAVIAFTLKTLLHEAVGHAATCLALGGTMRGIEVGVVSGGVAHCTLPLAATAFVRAIVSGGGIGVELLAGALALATSRRIRSTPLAAFVLCFAASALFGSTFYLAFGLFYGVGDPAALVEIASGSLHRLRLGEGHAWTAFAMALPILGFVLMREYLPLQARVFSGKAQEEIVATTAATMGCVLVAFLALVLTVGRATNRSPVFEDAVHARASAEVVESWLAIGTVTRHEMRGAPERELRRVIRARIDTAGVRRRDSSATPVLAFASFLLVLFVAGGTVALLLARRARRK